jgi:hypothetical protein
MNGRGEVATLQSRLDAVFARGESLAEQDSELQSDFSKYLCVLVSGFLEKAVSELLMEHARRTGAPSLQRFVNASTRKFTNANCEKLKETLGRFDPRWRDRLDKVLVDQYKDAVDGLIALRHIVAHGGDAGVTYRRMTCYYDLVKVVVAEIAELCAPIQ